MTGVGLALRIGSALAVVLLALWVVRQVQLVPELREDLRTAQEAHQKLEQQNKDLVEAASVRARVNKRLQADFAAIGAATEQSSHACDPQPIGDDYLVQLRRAAEAATNVSGSTASVAGADSTAHAAADDGQGDEALRSADAGSAGAVQR